MTEQLYAAPGFPALITDVDDWLADQSLGTPDIRGIVEGVCERLAAVGIPLWRAHVTASTLHPLFQATGGTWKRGEDFQLEWYAFQTDGETNAQWLASPLRYLMERRLPFLRRRLTGDEALLDFPVLEEFRDQGATDWLAYLVAFDGVGDAGMIGTWATDRPDGFSDAQIAALMHVQRPLSVAVKMAMRQQIADNVANTYLGPVAGRRVLAGQIRRGDGDTIPAVVWYSDLRGSTAMAEALGREQYTAILNCYFECMGGAVIDAGGEILDFIGDAILAIFPIEKRGVTRARAARRALKAAHDADKRLAHTNAARVEEGLPALSYGLALHVGDVMFGNIGTPERLTFSVIGSSVNEVARLQDLTKDLGRPVLASRAFADAAPGAWADLGEHPLRGVARPLHVFAPAEG